MDFRVKEKEVLLREVHHRVKNNMAVISSLLSLQSGYVDDKKYLEMFRESQSRIKSMALVHERLYKSDDLSIISSNDYFRALSSELSFSFSRSDCEIVLKYDIDEIALDIDIAIPCGLILNELVSNALKHAFQEKSTGIINIGFLIKNNSHYSLMISDNGKGIKDDFVLEKSETLGLRLVHILTEQLNGTVEYDKNDGTSFKIRFPHH